MSKLETFFRQLFGRREYKIIYNKVYIKEGFGDWQLLEQHIKEEHPELYDEMIEDLRKEKTDMGFIGLDTIVFISKRGLHYHLSSCTIVKDALTRQELHPDFTEDIYYGIEFKDVDHRQYKPCVCVSDKRKK